MPIYREFHVFFLCTFFVFLNLYYCSSTACDSSHKKWTIGPNIITQKIFDHKVYYSHYNYDFYYLSPRHYIIIDSMLFIRFVVTVVKRTPNHKWTLQLQAIIIQKWKSHLLTFQNYTFFDFCSASHASIAVGDFSSFINFMTL